MQLVGLTGPIGSGKSSALACFRAMGVPVHDADAAVHHLLTLPGIRKAIGKRFPDLVVDPQINRAQLGDLVFQNERALEWLEDLLHPFVRADQRHFLRKQARLRRRMVVLDVPLLFETGQDRACDVVMVMRTDTRLRFQRVLRRKGMSFKRLQRIEQRHNPIASKLKKADSVVGGGLHKGHLFQKIRKVKRQVCQQSVKSSLAWRPGWGRACMKSKANR